MKASICKYKRKSPWLRLISQKVVKNSIQSFKFNDCPLVALNRFQYVIFLYFQHFRAYYKLRSPYTK